MNAAAKYANESEEDSPALIAITLDLEMSRNFPTWETTHWDYEKGNLNDETKAYAVEAARRVKARGGRLHFFAVGRVLEQENVDWLKQIAADGHPLGNHTYDHVNVNAHQAGGHPVPLPALALADRGPEAGGGHPREHPAGQRGHEIAAGHRGRRLSHAGRLCDRDWPIARTCSRCCSDLGFKWVSSKYPAHPINPPKEGEPPMEPTDELIASIVAAQAKAQPFVYPSGLVEVPMSPISDIGAFRTGRWKLEWFLKAIRAGVEWAIENRACFDFLAHPSCLYVTDPKFKTIDLICDLVEKAGPRAKLADLETLSQRAIEDMSAKIARVETFRVNYGVRGHFKFFEQPGGQPPCRPTVVVKLTTDDGTVGWGQCVPSPRWSYETVETCKTTIRHYLAPLLNRRDLLAIDALDIIHGEMNRAIAPSFSTGQPICKAGVDLALHDLAGRIAGRPLTPGPSPARGEGRETKRPVALSWTINVGRMDEVEPQDGGSDSPRLPELQHQGRAGFGV